MYNKAISILTSQGKFHINLGLERINKLLELLNNPQDNLKVIHVAGTNGKGSTCAMLASILTEAGYKTALYTSPHLVEYTERIKINNKNISKRDFAQLTLEILELANKNNIPATEFEILTALAFVYFKENKADFVVLETGLGGRLDATNIVKNPLVSILTSIDIDHADRLGNTTDKIAQEKAGIIKNKVPVITLKYNNGLDIIKKISLENASPLILADNSNYKLDFCKIITEKDEYELPLLGFWQLKNLALVLKTIEILNKTEILVPKEAVKSGLKKVSWQGRFQYIKEKNLILDGAHNPSAAKLLCESLDFYFPAKKRIWIYSSLNTKDFESMINILFRHDDIVIFTKSLSKNSVDPEILKEKFLLKNPLQRVYTSNNINKSIDLSSSLKENSSIVIIAGSLYTVGEFLSI
ncbi:MAG: folylpolyglutamate synthase/dihydrofolate synthase family protein [bacterium]